MSIILFIIVEPISVKTINNPVQNEHNVITNSFPSDLDAKDSLNLDLNLRGEVNLVTIFVMKLTFKLLPSLNSFSGLCLSMKRATK
ncbi:hypothetical protein SDC9_194935 [bioreactor metagenome]|uniref:Uncharacterized protein n=1 Tax=bioreactor metagenome TaxID=1076179 RepID=A0A645IJ18_9ZZZZ